MIPSGCFQPPEATRLLEAAIYDNPSAPDRATWFEENGSPAVGCRLTLTLGKMGALRTMVFVDGENLVMRYQAMLAEGRTPKKGVAHIPDVFVWCDAVLEWSIFDLRRVSYYSTVVGDDVKIQDCSFRIGSTQYEYSHEVDSEVPKGSSQIVPYLFKKEKPSRKTRMIDIHIVIDIMRHALSPAIDAIYLFSGDGDYLPLIEEVMRHGKQVYVSAFSSGLNQKLVSRVDQFCFIDDDFFEPLKKPNQSLEPTPLKRSGSS